MHSLSLAELPRLPTMPGLFLAIPIRSPRSRRFDIPAPERRHGHALRHGRGSCRICWLEDDLNSQLHVEGLAGSDSGSTVEVSYGVADQAESTEIRGSNRLASAGGASRHARTRGDRSGSRLKVDAVE